MDTYLEGILIGLLPALGIAVWYLVRRYNEKQPLNEEIERVQKTAELKKTLEQYNYSIEDLREFQDSLMGRSEVAKALGESFANEANRIGETLSSKTITQAEMNEAASLSLQATNIKLDHVISELKKHFNPAEIAGFNQAQDAWENYQKVNAEFAASQYEGGSIMPLIYASTLESAAITRLVELESELKLRKNI